MIRLGIIGSGFGLYGLVPAFYPVKGCTITCVTANHPDRIRKYCTPRKITRIYNNWQHMLKNERLDAVAIAVTPKAQYDIASVILKNSIPVFAEKPLADTYAHAQTLASLAQQHHVTTAMDFLFPEIPQWQKVKAFIDNKAYGNLVHLSVNWDFMSYDIAHGITSWKTDPVQGGGAVSFYFSHTLYYLELFGGRIQDIQSELTYAKRRPGGETGVDCIFRYRSGITGTAHLSCNAPRVTRHQLVFLCETATIELINNLGFVDNFRVIIHRRNTAKTLFFPSPKTEEDQRVLAVRSIASRFIAACAQRKPMFPSLAEGLRVQELIREIRRDKRLLKASDRRSQ
ncbi:Gfo/Idh/MocA family oxidoreductase [Patescibacteria group bacterium]|nr:Gfo/Idh/MocA family oxidoreductase [Patescibacteria group bacterium]MBU1472924.1 Gfo/Idh/MocA family oxidoreductase [Patescibacteria group bacterium]MBU2460334.1 Gfo/Idh/MocA family oxidoreductase [Patescibacteria group bacterium]